MPDSPYKYCPFCAASLALKPVSQVLRPTCPGCGFISFFESLAQAPDDLLRHIGSPYAPDKRADRSQAYTARALEKPLPLAFASACVWCARGRYPSVCSSSPCQLCNSCISVLSPSSKSSVLQPNPMR